MADYLDLGAAQYKTNDSIGKTFDVSISNCDRCALEHLTHRPEKKTRHLSHHETADNYHTVVASLCPRHRVIICRDGLQWILQLRKRGGAERSWRAVGYFRTRDALMRFSATLCGRIDPKATAILAALSRQIGDAS